MNSQVKQEVVRLGFSLLFLLVTIAVLWAAYPKLMERGSKKQASAYWKAEREANEARLFGEAGGEVS
jgi:hypothetical protein